MEFSQKLILLRRQKELTQEELAEKLFVSRTAVSKWESGRGYPSIESLKKISEIFSVSLDELLSAEETVVIAEKDKSENHRRIIDLIFGLLDIAAIALFFLPFFGEKTGEVIKSVALVSLHTSYLTVLYYIFVSFLVLCGILTLALQGFEKAFWTKHKSPLSLLLSLTCVLLFTVSLQPYAAVLLLLFLVIKALTLKVSSR